MATTPCANCGGGPVAGHQPWCGTAPGKVPGPRGFAPGPVSVPVEVVALAATLDRARLADIAALDAIQDAVSAGGDPAAVVAAVEDALREAGRTVPHIPDGG
jgi:hypothetical protein